MRRTWLRGRENVHKRYLIHVAGHNLGILMRHLIGAGTPKEAAARGRAFLFVNYRDADLLGDRRFALMKPASASSWSPSPPSHYDHNAHIVNLGRESRRDCRGSRQASDCSSDIPAANRIGHRPVDAAVQIETEPERAGPPRADRRCPCSWRRWWETHKGRLGGGVSRMRSVVGVGGSSLIALRCRKRHLRLGAMHEGDVVRIARYSRGAARRQIRAPFGHSRFLGERMAGGAIEHEQGLFEDEPRVNSTWLPPHRAQCPTLGHTMCEPQRRCRSNLSN